MSFRIPANSTGSKWLCAGTHSRKRSFAALQRYIEPNSLAPLPSVLFRSRRRKFSRLYPKPRKSTLWLLATNCYLPLNDSFDPFCQGVPGSMQAVSIRASHSQRRTARETNSGTLSDLRYRGAP
jgi:hypothetical protein